MLPLLESLARQVTPAAALDVALTAVFIYWGFLLIRGTRAVTLVIGVSLLVGAYGLAQLLELRLLTQLLQAGAVVGLLALVVVFQPELRRALERIGRVGTLRWLVAPTAAGRTELVVRELAAAAAALSAAGHGALVVVERETGLEEIAETGVMLRAELSEELLRTVFVPRAPLHDGAVIVRGGELLAAGAVLPLGELAGAERYGTRHRAALGITAETDAVALVVSEENGQIGLVAEGRITRVAAGEPLVHALTALLDPPAAARLRGAREVGSWRPSRPGRLLRRAATVRPGRSARPGDPDPAAAGPAPDGSP